MIGLIVVGLVLSSAAQAQQSVVPDIYREMSALQRLPSEVVYSIALTESGKLLENKTFRPWPWTLNFESKGKRYKSQDEMCEALGTFLNMGKTNIDIGLMQINWKSHSQRFSSFKEACDPYINLKTGIAILKQYTGEKKGLWKGVGRYHSGTKELAKAYQARVAHNLVTHVIDKSRGQR